MSTKAKKAEAGYVSPTDDRWQTQENWGGKKVTDPVKEIEVIYSFFFFSILF